MIDERHIEADEAHHIPYGVWSSVAERSTVNRDCAGSNPVTPPMRLRDYQREALNGLAESFATPASLMRGSGPTLPSPVVAQLVERWSETPRVAGSSPACGTKRKPKM